MEKLNMGVVYIIKGVDWKMVDKKVVFLVFK